jgi:MscS family membrane protein
MCFPNTLALALGLVAIAAGGARAQEPTTDCESPRSAVITWLGSLQESGEDPAAAIRCFDWEGANVGEERRADLARRLKQVLDAGGHWVEVDDLPDEVAPEGVDRVRLFDTKLPELYLVRADDRWVISAESVRAIPTLYEETFTLDLASFVETLPEWARDRPFFGVTWWQLIGLLLAILLGLVARALIAFVVATYGVRLIARKGQAADDSIVAKAARPIGTVAMAGVLWYLLPLLQFSVRVNQILNLSIRVLAAVAVVVVLYRVVDLISNIFERRAARTDTKLDDQLIPLVRRTLKVFVVVVGVIFVLQNMDVDVTSLLAIGTVGTLAFSFAAQDTVANLFGSVSIFADRPFQIGDWVVIGEVEGVVEEVGMRSTRIRTFYSSLITLPNSLITKTPVDNYGVRRYRRTSTTVGVTYDTTPEQMQAFCEGIRAILNANPHVRKDAYEIHFKGFGASSLDVMLYFFFETDSWSVELRERHNIYLEVLRLAHELSIDFAFPTQTLHVASLTTPEPPASKEIPASDVMRDRVLAFAPGGDLARPTPPRIAGGFFAGSASSRGNEDGG